jgi:hypothetical protein
VCAAKTRQLTLLYACADSVAAYVYAIEDVPTGFLRPFFRGCDFSIRLLKHRDWLFGVAVTLKLK